MAPTNVREPDDRYNRPGMHAVNDEQELYDVAVLGGGNAGLCAALTARESGASVVVLEARRVIIAEGTAATRATSGACMPNPASC